MEFSGCIDEPTRGARCYRQRIPVRGWVFAGRRHSSLQRISVSLDDQEIGSTPFLYERADVSAALSLPPQTATGFRLLACVLDPRVNGTDHTLVVRAHFTDHTAVDLDRIPLSFFARDFTDAPYGDLCNPQKTAPLQRSHIYSSGRPAEHASPDCVELVSAYLKPGYSILDVGCGIGAYAAPLQERGFRWTGCEIAPRCLEILRQRRLSVRPIRRPLLPFLRSRLPAGDREFDAAIAIEVLEHTRDPDAFVREIARVARHRALFSVPNLEILPFLADRLAAPWHILEGDHRNFYTRFNLRALLTRHFRHVDILDYAPHPLASPDGLLLGYHLLAICSV
jgi:2-polyprenyl-3-methyl-5-hydroxy-6-metoxy-1,4-benzoquinol methylase